MVSSVLRKNDVVVKRSDLMLDVYEDWVKKRQMEM